MEVLELIKQRHRMCDYYGDVSCVCDDSRETCPALNIDCSLGIPTSERLVAIVEQWAKEHPEKPEQEQQKPEHPEEAADVTKPKQDDPCVKTIQDQLEGAIYREIISNKTKIEKLEHDVEERVEHLEKCCDEMNERLTCFIHDTVDEVQAIKKHAEHQDKFMQTKCVHVDSAEVESMNEPKRTNKDVLLETFPRMVMDGGVPVLCPRTMDRDIHIQYCAGRSCYQCRCEYWLSEVEK